MVLITPRLWVQSPSGSFTPHLDLMILVRPFQLRKYSDFLWNQIKEHANKKSLHIMSSQRCKWFWFQRYRMVMDHNPQLCTYKFGLPAIEGIALPKQCLWETRFLQHMSSILTSILAWIREEYLVDTQFHLQPFSSLKCSLLSHVLFSLSAQLSVIEKLFPAHPLQLHP